MKPQLVRFSRATATSLQLPNEDDRQCHKNIMQWQQLKEWTEI